MELLFVLGCVYIGSIPYSKVEESFNMQAIHDILNYHVQVWKYDHLEFPGVVPRSFVPALVVSFGGFPMHWLVCILKLSKFYLQYVVRGVLWYLVFRQLVHFQNAISTRFGKDTGIFFLLITGCQFHFMFYASRTLPNTFALVLILKAYQCWFVDKPGDCIVLLTMTSIIIRADTVVLFAPILLLLLGRRKISMYGVIFLGMVASMVALTLTIAVDSFFWRKWIWPEGAVLYFNTVLNKSSEWGTMPFHWYFTSAIPRAMSGTLALLPLGLSSISFFTSAAEGQFRSYMLDRRAMTHFVPAIMFISLYSILPHKELRFILCAIPIFNVIAALGLAKAFRARKKNWIPFLLGVGCVLTTCLTTLLFFTASYYNYPGGDAFAKLHTLQQHQRQIPKKVHIDVPAAMTGVSRFGEVYPAWTYSKKESWQSLNEFDYILTSTPDQHSDQFEQIGDPSVIFESVAWRERKITTKPHTYIMAKKEK